MAKKTAPAQETPANKPTREESTAYLGGVVAKVLGGERVGDEDYRRVAGYLDSRRGGLSDAGVNRFAEVEEVKSLHDKVRGEYPAKAKAILTDHKDILLKMFNAKPGQKSITKEEYSKVAPVLEEPLSRGTEKGGFIREAYLVAKELGAKDLMEAAEQYRETIRVHVLSPLYLSGIYVRQNSGSTVTQDEKADLKKGITVIEGGKSVDKAFVENGKLTKFGHDTCNSARRMLGGKKGQTLDLAVQISDNKARKSQIAPPKPRKDAGPEMAD